LALDGKVAALASGEVNRPDGLPEVVVAVDTRSGWELLVYESPRGALNGEPERFPLPAPVTALALGQLDDHPGRDVAVAAGDHLIVIHGRDRRLTRDPSRQAEVSAPRIEVQKLPLHVAALEIGDFYGGHERELAVLAADGTLSVLARAGSSEAGSDGRESPWLPVARFHSLVAPSHAPEARVVKARISTSPKDDLIVSDREDPRVYVVHAEESALAAEPTILVTTDVPVAVLPMQLNLDALDDLVVLQEDVKQGPAIIPTVADPPYYVGDARDLPDANLADELCDVDLVQVGEQCTLRAAIQNANAYDGGGTRAINFGISTVQPQSALPVIARPVIIEGFESVLLTGGGSGNHGLVISGGSSRVRGMTINGFNCGILIQNAGNNHVENNLIGTDIDGTAAVPNGRGVCIEGSPDNHVGGPVDGDGNVISGNTGDGVRIEGEDATGNRVLGNFIGLDLTGMAPLGNTTSGVTVDGAPANLIGVPGSANVISANGTGVFITNAGATGNLVQNNLIGTDSEGLAAVGNSMFGVHLNDAPLNSVGGTATGLGNTISANLTGINIFSWFVPMPDTRVEGNFIGTDLTGSQPLGNQTAGVTLSAGGVTIGGTAHTPGVCDQACNLISGTTDVVTGAGISLFVAGCTVQGNFIGTDLSGTVPIPNNSGIEISGGNALVGGVAPGAGNLISGNGHPGTLSGHGVGLRFGPSTVQGNRIGTDATGNAALGNLRSGIYMDHSYQDLIGGLSPAARNIISGNGEHGIHNHHGQYNTIRDNYIGTSVSGSSRLGNTLDGVFLENAPYNWVLDNVVSANGLHGIEINNFGLLGVARENILAGNRIGTDARGVSDLGNVQDGLFINAGYTLVVAPTAEEANVISGNDGHGIHITGEAWYNEVQGNYIGTGFTGTTELVNSGHGILIDSDSSENTVGGTDALEANTIAFNGGDGVFVESGYGNAIRANRVFANGGQGIDLGPDGVTPNDVGDADLGANGQQNFPVLTGASATLVQGTLNSHSYGSYRLDFYANATCDPSGHGEGRQYLTSTTASTDGQGDLSFSVALPGGLVGPEITATATDPGNSTSEFSACLSTGTPVDVDFGDAPEPYPTTVATNGAYHLFGLLYLGQGIDPELDGQPHEAAAGDDEDGNDDEDGIVFATPVVKGYEAVLNVTSSDHGLLNAWIDFNADGDWADGNEQIVGNEFLFTGVNELTFAVPAGALSGTTFARFRLSSQANLSVIGGAMDGEVEDYPLPVQDDPPVPSEPAELQAVVSSPGSAGIVLSWEENVFADVYNVYRSDRTDLSTLTCFAPDLTVTSAADGEPPPPMSLFVYLVTCENYMGESILGYASGGAMRANPSPCP
jgi:hypothetical protein